MKTVTTVNEYIEQLDEGRQEVVQKIREVILKNLPEGFEETIDYGMIAYVVPLSIYPKGYRNDKKHPLPFVSLASQKNYISLYHMGVYSDKPMLDWFTESYAAVCKTKLDMGKGCIRFKKMDDIPYNLIAQLMQKITPQQWVEQFERVYNKK